MRSPESRFNLANFMRANLYTALGALKTESLTDYLAGKVFHDSRGTGMDPVPEDVEGYEQFMKRYTEGLAVERAAVECL